MRWAKSEYILKGVFLGLLLFVSLQQNLDWPATGRVALWLAGGFGIALVLSAARQFRDLKSLGRNPLGFLLFLLLENPFLIYCGIVFGLAGAAIELYEPNDPLAPKADLPFDMPIIYLCVLGGAFFGYGLGELKQIAKPMLRLGVVALLCAGVGVMLYYWLEDLNLLGSPEQRTLLGTHLLLGIPFFYLLVFCGLVEESEVEIAALCATLGLGLWMVKFPSRMPALGFLLPVGLYCIYTIRILKPLRVFKHSLRGYGHAEVGRIRDALASFNRALALDPKNQLARSGLVRLHRGLSLAKLDPATRALLNPNLVVHEAAGMLLGGPPTATQLKEANDLLDFVAGQWPQMKASTDYYKAVAETHGRDLDAASARLGNLLNPSAWPAGDAFRDSVLFDAWQLALRTHPELKRRVGDVQLALPGRRVEALRAIERQLRIDPADAVVAGFRSELLVDLTGEEYAGAASGGAMADFPYAVAEETGLPLLADAATWRQGALLTRIAAHGQPERGPGIFQRLAETADKFGDASAASGFRRQARAYGQEVGPANLSADQVGIYFGVVKKLAEEAAAAKDWKEAIVNYRLSSQSETSGKETLRQLAQMYENDGQVLAALRTVEDALTRGSDKDLAERKDRYYYSVNPEELRAKADEVRGHFDVNYCVKKAKSVLDAGGNDLDALDWATHLCTVVLVLEPKHLVATALLGRCQLRRGERDEGLRLLENVLEMKPSGGEEREMREWTLRQAGALYLDDYNRPDLAIECLKEFVESEKSGAKTLYDLGRAYEASGDDARAVRYYQQAAVFEDNPIRWDAEAAIRRIKEKGAPSSTSDGVTG